MISVGEKCIKKINGTFCYELHIYVSNIYTLKKWVGGVGRGEADAIMLSHSKMSSTLARLKQGKYLGNI